MILKRIKANHTYTVLSNCWLHLVSATVSSFVCRITQQNRSEATKCKVYDVFSKNNPDYNTFVCGPATYVVDQTPSLTEVSAASSIFCTL